MALLIVMAGGMVVGAFLKLFADHRAFRRQLHEVEQQLETVLDVLGTVALNAGDTARIDRVQRQVRAKNEERAAE